MTLRNDEDVSAAVCCQSYEIKVDVVVHVRKLGWVHERIGVTRDEPHRHATTTRSVRQPDSGAMLGEACVERGAHFIIGAKKDLLLTYSRY